MQGARVDSYYTRVEQLLRDYHSIKADLQVRLEKLNQDLAQVVEGVVLRGYPTDMEIIPGHKDSDARIESDIRQIAQEKRWCNAEIRQVTGELKEIMQLESQVMRMTGKPGQVLRALYIDRMTWDAVEEQGLDRKSIYRYRKIGIEKAANRLYSRIRS